MYHSHSWLISTHVIFATFEIRDRLIVQHVWLRWQKGEIRCIFKLCRIFFAKCNRPLVEFYRMQNCQVYNFILTSPNFRNLHTLQRYSD